MGGKNKKEKSKKVKKNRGGLFLSCLGGCGGRVQEEAYGGDSAEEVEELDFRHKSLTQVPPDVFASECTLERLYLDSNQISELPRELFHCHGLKELTIADNELQSLPSAVSALTVLASLDVSKNNLSTIPDSIKGCRELARVDASINPLCKLPEGFTQLMSLRELYLNDTFLEYLPANFGRLINLEVLELRENVLNTLPKSLSRLSKLRSLDIGSNEFSQLPEVVGSLPSLKELWFDNNRVRFISPFIGNLKEIRYIDASNNRIDSLPDEIEHCTKLVDLLLSGNHLKTLPDSMSHCVSLETLKLDDNALSELPAKLGNMNKLTELVVTQNDLQKLPASIGLLRSLHTLHADDNMLESVPAEIGSCTQLAILTLANNRLSSLPPEMGHLSSLKVLNVWDNTISNLPVSFSKLKLMALWLAENQAKPSVQLQSETDPLTGHKVLTCFMLPQQPLQPRQERAPVDEEPFPMSTWEERHKARSVIKFSFDENNEEYFKTGAKLSRAPTPYPKELRALAKHARNLTSGAKHIDGVEATQPVTGRRNSRSSASEETRESEVKSEEGVEVRKESAEAPSVAYVRTSSKATSESGELTSGDVSKQDQLTTGAHEQTQPAVTDKKQLTDATTDDDLDSLAPSDLLAEAMRVADQLANTKPREADQSSTDSGYCRPSHVNSSCCEMSDQGSELMSPLSSLPSETPLTHRSSPSPSLTSNSPLNGGSPAKVPIPSTTEIPLYTHQMRPGSLALNHLAEAGVLSDEAGYINRPGSLAAPCNTVGIPPAPTRSTSAATGLNNQHTPTTSLPTAMPIAEQSPSTTPILSPTHTLSNGVEGGAYVPVNTKPSVTRQHSGSHMSRLPTVNSKVIPQRVSGSKMPSYTPPLPNAVSIETNSSRIPSVSRTYSNSSMQENTPLKNTPPTLQKQNSLTKESRIPHSGLSSNISKSQIPSAKFSPVSRIPSQNSYSALKSSPHATKSPYDSNRPNTGHNGSFGKSGIAPPSYSNMPRPSPRPTYSSPTNKAANTHVNAAYSKTSSSVPPALQAINTSGLPPTQQAINTSGLPPNPPSLQRKGSGLKPPSASTLNSRIPQFASNGTESGVSSRISISDSQAKADQQQWMFGNHQNTRVFPVIIEKNPGPGFSLIKSPAPENCVFVSSVEPNGPSYTSLKTGDKILQIDGETIGDVMEETFESLMSSNGDSISLLVSRTH